MFYLNEMKNAGVALITKLIMRIPSNIVRLGYLKCVLGDLGKGCFVARCCEIRVPKRIHIGNHVIINKKTLLDGRGGEIFIGNNVDIAQETNIWTLQHDYNDDNHRAVGETVFIDDYVWIAARSTILPGVHINKGGVVATCGVVTKDVPTMTVVGGVPAKPIATRKSNLLYTMKYRPLIE